LPAAWSEELEGSYWFRLSVIFALFTGAIYVLLPTILQEDSQSRMQAAADQLDVGQADKKVKLEIAYDLVRGAPEEHLDVLAARFDSAKIDVDRIVIDDDQVVVKLKPGTDAAAVRAAVLPVGHRELYDAATLLGDDPLPADAEPDLAKLSSGVEALLAEAGFEDSARLALAVDDLTDDSYNVPPELGSLDLELVSIDSKNKAETTAAVEALAFLFVDAELSGLVGSGRYVPLCKPQADGFDCPNHADVLSTVGLPGPLNEILAEAAITSDEDAPKKVTEKVESNVPAWLVGILPDTRMNLGLDLQGGVDITLQVDLEEAVLTQVARDTAFVEEQGAREGLTFIEVRADHSDPLILITTDDEIDSVTKFVRKQLPDYIYTYTDGNLHSFEMSDERQELVQTNSVEQVLETLRKRIDALGTKEPSIYKRGGGSINVQLPGEVNLESALEAIRTAAVLEFRMVKKDVNEDKIERDVRDAERLLDQHTFNDDKLLNQWLWDEGRLARNDILLWGYEEQADKTKLRAALPTVAVNKVDITGNDINDAGVSYDQNNQPYVRLEFKPRGSTVFCDLSSAHVNEQFAIILDDELISAPVIRDRICGGVASIEMGQDIDPLKAANNLALVLRTGSLDAPVLVGNVRTVGSTLGADSIRAGTFATVFGAMVVLVFMGLWYGKAGMAANLALILNVMLAMATLSIFGATLTLPGIAGIALTVGMAVDANIIIYERIREELALGVNARKAVDTGFEKGLVAVLDANITTAIAGVVLFSYGTGPIKGFAVTLLIGIMTTLITALFVTRAFMDILTRSSTARLRL
jgi:preprotein translocase subunit SecD